jgi:hypothetical protein
MSITFKGFSTKKDLSKQLKKAGATLKLGFVASPELDVEKDPFEGIPTTGADGKPQKIVKKTKAQLKEVAKRIKKK